MRHCVRTALLAAGALATLGCTAMIGPSEPDLPAAAQIAGFAELVNEYRQAAGCETLAWHPDGARVAQAHSDGMVERNFFGHVNPDGQTPFDRIRAAAIPYRRAAENVAWGFETAQHVFDAWVASDLHRANIRNCNYTHHGVGFSGSHWTHVFLTPE